MALSGSSPRGLTLPVTPERGGVYVRISQDTEGRSAGVRRQEEDCRALNERRGWPVSRVFTDNDTSAYNGKPRRAYRELLAAIESKEIDAVTVWHLDRLHRHPKELEEFFEVCDRAGLKNLACVSGDIDLSTDDGRFHARILGAVGRKESDDKSRRIRRKHLELAKAGMPGGGGQRPFGYEDDRITIRKTEAVLIRQAAKRLLAGESLRGIVVDFNERGIKTPKGNTWKPSSFRDMMRGARLAGMREHLGKTYPAVWKPILTKETHERVRAVLDNPDRRTHTLGTARRYLMTGGLAVCGLCKTPLVARPTQAGKRCYICPVPRDGGCGKIRRLAEPVEEYLAGQLFEAFERSRKFIERLKRSADNGEERGLLEDLHGYQQRRAEIETAYASGGIDLKTFMRVSTDLDERIARTEQALAERTGDRVLSNLPSARVIEREWDRRPLEWRRAVVGAFIKRVTIMPAVHGRSTFDPTRVKITWRV